VSQVLPAQSCRYWEPVVCECQQRLDEEQLAHFESYGLSSLPAR